jgi:hypothetical protein
VSYVVANPASEASVGMFRLGFTNHHPSFMIDERAQPAGIQTLRQTALHFLPDGCFYGSQQLSGTYLYLKRRCSTLAS